MTWSGSPTPWPLALAPHFVNKDYAPAEITWHCTCTSWGSCLVTGYFEPWASPWEPWLLLHWGHTGAASGLCYLRLSCGHSMVMLWLLLCLLCQPGERLCDGFCASQERINVSEAPTAPCIFFQPLSSCLSYPGFNKQYRHWIARQLVLWTGVTIHYIIYILNDHFAIWKFSEKPYNMQMWVKSFSFQYYSSYFIFSGLAAVFQKFLLFVLSSA